MGCPGPPDLGNHQSGGVKEADVFSDTGIDVCAGVDVPRCELRYVPEQLDFGTLNPGDAQSGTLLVRNTGTGDCIFSEWVLTPCVFQDNTFNCEGNIQSAFTVLDAPDNGEVLAPGDEIAFSVYFQAPNENTQNLASLKHYARLAAFFVDPCDTSSLTLPTTDSSQSINLAAGVDGAHVTISPSKLDFGVLRDDCPPANQSVKISNVGPTSLSVTSAQMVGCPPSLTLSIPANLPMLLGGFKTVALGVQYQGEGDQEVACVLEITTDAPNLGQATLEIRARSTASSEQQDVFIQTAKPKLDILFVVDNSNSMEDEQGVLALGLPTLVEKASLAGQVVQMAVTTTDSIEDSGVMMGDPPYVGGDAIEEFVERLSSIGLDGALMERGLEAAWLALSGDNVEANGPNDGFLRSDAELAIIFVSDEDDHSPDSIEGWVQRFQSLKPLWTGVGVTVHSVVATSDDCSDLATIGARYIAVSNAFGGQVVNICSVDFAEQFNLQGSLAFSAKDRFYPTYPPEPQSLEVRVDGEVCESGWTWNSTAKAVIFDPLSDSFPNLGASVALNYEVVCP